MTKSLKKADVKWRFLPKIAKTGFLGFLQNRNQVGFKIKKPKVFKTPKLEAICLIFSNSRDVSILALNCKSHVVFNKKHTPIINPDPRCVFQTIPYEKA